MTAESISSKKSRKSRRVSRLEEDEAVHQAVKATFTNAQKKLFIAIGLCTAFMLVELLAGLFAHSLAVLTDAAHMLSDVCSFAVSLFAIHISAMPGTKKMSFGYARAEILGALFSVVVIWGLTIWLVAEAISRIIHPEAVKAPIMVYTAIFGIVTNIVLATVLDHHHGHGHSHGHTHVHSHGHTHRHSHSHSHSHSFHEGVHEGDHPEKHRDCSEEKQEPPVSSEPSDESSSPSSLGVLDELPTPSAGAAAESYKAAASLFKDLSRRSMGTPRDTLCRRSSKRKESMGEDVYVAIAEEEEPTTEHHHDHHDSKNINISAAYLHALGDLFQNLGVLIGGLVIWWKPNWSIADPICTLIFSVVVFSTTIGILRDTANVLMEGTPTGIDPTQLVADLHKLPNVSEVHDVHVWSLSIGQPSLACHIVIDDPTKAKRVLALATSLVQVKYMILHTTIQIDFSSNKSSCETNAHVKCH
eukprot:Blabericola_migrator_1__3512@NODE_2040_length_3379_cov_208_454710_g1295_i0_p1_GENE_NODE_2040_length_3379_cov_208_454710_g1295_i0NODE_2040_length_3379_cov_208_454710_g1295_i0_p1_ORF_typecomplete_len472_score78_82Cation_efflux/PF01545_21/1_9e53Herpes_LMP1/PF05297_11/0_00018Herpes_LMP1/PF05297_11/1_9e03NicO/PF03824_16/8_5e02NicO/PF03824_16/0_01NicO/PF03824_16/3_2e02DUF4436/PF14494_6/5_2DUF4436/PF14494_6/40_NODE_2040_length_3379_cov_208_454710_g1295_i06432058